MKERPILFSGPMVRALLDGRKTQTRRIVKPRHDWTMDQQADGSPWPFFEPYVYAEALPVKVPCPYGVPGDRLWVRETWTPALYEDAVKVALHKEGHETNPYAKGTAWKWKPSIHMPRWASRLTLTLTDVRVERVQEITNVAAQAEGVTHWNCGHPECFDDAGTSGKHFGPRAAFYELWDSINGKGSWNANPWVWALTFTVDSPTPGASR